MLSSSYLFAKKYTFGAFTKLAMGVKKLSSKNETDNE